MCRVLLLALALLAARSASASPPACFRDDAAMIVASEAVFTAEMVDARVSRVGDSRQIEARYRLTGVIKGILKPGQRIRVVASCLDQPVPREQMGYPVVEHYCSGGGPVVTGVNEAGRPQPSPPGGWLLFLELSRGDDFWKEVSRTGYYGGCSVDQLRLGPADRRALQRLRETHVPR